MQAIGDGEVVAFLKWSGNVLKVYLPGGTILGRLYRSDGKRQHDKITYTFTAWTARDPTTHQPGGTESDEQPGSLRGHHPPHDQGPGARDRAVAKAVERRDRRPS